MILLCAWLPLLMSAMRENEEGREGKPKPRSLDTADQQQQVKRHATYTEKQYGLNTAVVSSNA